MITSIISNFLNYFELVVRTRPPSLGVERKPRELL